MFEHTKDSSIPGSIGLMSLTFKSWCCTAELSLFNRQWLHYDG